MGRRHSLFSRMASRRAAVYGSRHRYLQCVPVPGIPPIRQQMSPENSSKNLAGLWDQSEFLQRFTTARHLKMSISVHPYCPRLVNVALILHTLFDIRRPARSSDAMTVCLVEYTPRHAQCSRQLLRC